MLDQKHICVEDELQMTWLQEDAGQAGTAPSTRRRRQPAPASLQTQQEQKPAVATSDKPSPVNAQLEAATAVALPDASDSTAAPTRRGRPSRFEAQRRAQTRQAEEPNPASPQDAPALNGDALVSMPTASEATAAHDNGNDRQSKGRKASAQVSRTRAAAAKGKAEAAPAAGAHQPADMQPAAQAGAEQPVLAKAQVRSDLSCHST